MNREPWVMHGGSAVFITWPWLARVLVFYELGSELRGDSEEEGEPRSLLSDFISPPHLPSLALRCSPLSPKTRQEGVAKENGRKSIRIPQFPTVPLHAASLF